MINSLLHGSLAKTEACRSADWWKALDVLIPFNPAFSPMKHFACLAEKTRPGQFVPGFQPLREKWALSFFLSELASLWVTLRNDFLPFQGQDIPPQGQPQEASLCRCLCLSELPSIGGFCTVQMSTSYVPYTHVSQH